ncbi:hypothetical protein XENTR_v10007472 [Xenopus tropicalis]|nr:hypothetical protein XENTR_v10007472 [Xenopus tropicalis]
MLEEFPDSVLLDDTVGYFSLTGSQFVSGINGFLGPTAYHRNKITFTEKASPPKLIQSLQLPHWHNMCREFQDHVKTRYQSFLAASEWQPAPGTCRDVFQELITHYSTISSGPMCTEMEAPPMPKRATVTRLLRRSAELEGGRYLNMKRIGRALYYIYLRNILSPNGLARIKGSIILLLQAGCLGYDPALYLASVLFQTGFGIKMDPSKALMLKLVAAQRDERLSVMSLGHKHHMGGDGYPVDYDLSYAYYANIAFQSTEDRLQPNRDQSYVENIRLIDEEVLKLQTKEDDDLFMWLRHQAKQGVVSAQQSVSRMLYWGQQGISSNPEAAARFYEKGAVQQKDPVLMYDYGVVLLRGHGVKQDIPKALEYLQKAADMNFVPAINSLGWYYERYEGNYQKAIEYWEKADDLWNAEAPFNIGIMYFNGYYPGQGKNYTAAYHYYLKSATRGHIDAAVHVSFFWIKGIPGVVPRKPRDAVVWTKWAAEQNGYLGMALRKGLDGYLKHSWLESLLHYIQAAEAGFEIAQFNAAYICERDPDGLVSRYVHTDCMWKYYNLSVSSSTPSSYAQIKMGDLLYTSHIRRKRNVQAAVQMYKAAALMKDPQGLYNLGILVEDGVPVPWSTLRELGFNRSMYSNNYTIAMELYRRCRDHESDESYIPCSLALINAQIQYIWAFHGILLKCSSAAAIAIVTAFSLVTILGRLRQGALIQLQSV